MKHKIVCLLVIVSFFFITGVNAQVLTGNMERFVIYTHPEPYHATGIQHGYETSVTYIRNDESYSDHATHMNHESVFVNRQVTAHQDNSYLGHAPIFTNDHRDNSYTDRQNADYGNFNRQDDSHITSRQFSGRQDTPRRNGNTPRFNGGNHRNSRQ